MILCNRASSSFGLKGSTMVVCLKEADFEPYIHILVIELQSGCCGCMSLEPTFTVLLIRVIGTVRLSVAAPLSINAASFVTLELEGRADGAVLLITAVVTFRKAVTTPRHRNTVNLTCGAGELLCGAGGRL